MVEDLYRGESRIAIFKRPLLCRFCKHDVFIPYTTYSNVENPGIQVYYVKYTAVCMHCGCVTQFSDPSRPDPETNNYIWALDQTLLNLPESEPPVDRIVDEETLNAQKRCLRLALSLLVQDNKVMDTVLSLSENEQYIEVIALLDPKTVTELEKNTAENCLATALLQLARGSIIDHDQLISILLGDSYPALEPFLEQHLK